MLQIQSFVFNALQENTLVLFDETKQCVIIDPGCYDQAERDELVNFVTTSALQVKMILNTHGHIDHVLGNAFLKDKYKVKLYIHRVDEPVLRAAKVYAPNYGFFQYQDATVDEYLEEGQKITFGNQTLDILFVPGHSPGHVAFYVKAEKILIGGDVLFYSSIGRTDLPGGDHRTLLKSIREKLFTLPEDVTVYPGHGPTTTIGYEKRNNPFCALSEF